MENTTIKNTGLLLLVLALLTMVFPLQFLSRTDRSIQVYQDAKGSALPSAYAFTQIDVFTKISLGFLVLGVVALSIYKWNEIKEEKLRRRRMKDECEPGIAHNVGKRSPLS